MRKTWCLGVLLGVMMLVNPALAKAREGALSLQGSNVACEGVSLWKSGGYRVSGRCDGLVYPYQTGWAYYVAWARMGNGNWVRVGEVERGYFEGSVNGSFEEVVISAEGESLPRRMSDKAIASGTVRAFVFDKSQAPAATPAPGTSENKTMTVQQAAGASTANVGSVLGKILRSLLIIVGVVVALVIGGSLLFRRRNSVSG